MVVGYLLGLASSLAAAAATATDHPFHPITLCCVYAVRNHLHPSIRQPTIIRIWIPAPQQRRVGVPRSLRRTDSPFLWKEQERGGIFWYFVYRISEGRKAAAFLVHHHFIRLCRRRLLQFTSEIWYYYCRLQWKPMKVGANHSTESGLVSSELGAICFIRCMMG